MTSERLGKKTAKEFRLETHKFASLGLGAAQPPLPLSIRVLGASGMELTPDTWDEATAGKTVFIKFLAPW